MKKRLGYLIAAMIALVTFMVPPGWCQLFSEEGGKPKPGTHAPVITQSFAVDKGKYGYIWKIYVEADDPDGNMIRLGATVDQVGYGRYPTSWTVLKPQYAKHFRGYLQFNTFSSRSAGLKEWTQISVSVGVLDKSGNLSNEVTFPFTFESGIGNQYSYKLPAPFSSGDPLLGHVMVDLIEPSADDASKGIDD